MYIRIGVLLNRGNFIKSKKNVQKLDFNYTYQLPPSPAHPPVILRNDKNLILLDI